MTNTTVFLKRSCPICFCAEGVRLHHQRFTLPDEHPLKNGYDVVCCVSCGFAFADTAATQKDYDRYYASLSKYSDSATSTGGGASSWDALRMRETVGTITGFEPDHGARILDMGCANGGMLKEFKELGYTNLAGIDPSPGCAAATRQLTGAETWQGTLFEMPPLKGIKGVVLSHVLEHVRDLQPALQAVHDMLDKDGWVYIEVPDAMRYEEFLVAPFQDFNTEHINHFSSKALDNLLKSAGFCPFAGAAKTILSAPRMPYPAVWVAGRKVARPEVRPVPAPDPGLSAALETYIRSSSGLLARLDERIKAILKNHPKIIVWGAGQLTLKLLSETCLGKASIKAFVDANPVHQGKFLHGAPILSPAQLDSHEETILAASLINQEAILENIKRLGIPNIVVTLNDERIS